MNWLEFFGKSNPDEAMAEIRKAVQSGLHTSPNGRFFVLDVREIRAAGKEAGRDLRVKRMPSPADESHAGIFGYTANDIEVEATLPLPLSMLDAHIQVLRDAPNFQYRLSDRLWPGFAAADQPILYGFFVK